MLGRIWQILDRFAGLGCVLALFCFLIVQANLEVRDLDLWLHLKTGEYILENKTIPQNDIFSFSLEGKRWVNHEWLFQVIAYLAYHFGGAEGLIRMQVVVVVLTFLILFFMDFDPLKRNYFAVALPLLFVLLVCRYRFTIRPDIFSMLFFAYYLYLLHKHLNKKWLIYVIPLVQILWSNFHGFFFLGILLLFITLVAEFLKRNVKLPWQWGNASRLADKDYNRLKLVFLLSILASFANPYTIDGFLYPFRILFQLSGKSRIFFEHIQELRQPLSLRSLFVRDGLVQYKSLILISFISFILNLRKTDIGKFAIWLLFLISSLIAVRNVAYFSFVAYFVYLFNKDYIFPLKSFSIRFQNNSIKLVTQIVFKVALIIWVLSALDNLGTSGYFDFNKYEMKSDIGGMASNNYPTGAAEFILNNNIRGNIFNDFNSGAFLIGKCFPQIKVYIDGRTEMYGPDFFEANRKLLSEDSKPFDGLAKKYNIKCVLLSGVYYPITNNLSQYLYKGKDWKLVYLDPFAVIFLKEVPENKDLIEKYKIDLNNWTPPELNIRKIGTSTPYPFPNINRAYIFESLNLDNAVIKEAQAALKIMPNCGNAFKFLGRVYKKQNLLDKAFENLRLAAIYLPVDADTKMDLSLLYIKLNDTDNAIKQLKEITMINPDFSYAHYYLSLIYREKNDVKKAKEYLTTAVRLPSPGLRNLAYIADSFYDKGYFDFAAQVYQQAIKADKEVARFHARLGACYTNLNKFKEAEVELAQAIKLNEKSSSAHDYLGVLYAKQGQGEKAKEQWKKALNLDPKNKEARDNIKKFIKGEFKAAK